MAKVSQIVSAFIGLAGLVIAIAAGIFNPEQGFPFSGVILLVLGLVIGFMVETKDVKNYVIYGLGLALGVGSLATLSSLSGLLETYLTGIFAHVVTLISAAVLAASLKAFTAYFVPKFK